MSRRNKYVRPSAHPLTEHECDTIALKYWPNTTPTEGMREMLRDAYDRGVAARSAKSVVVKDLVGMIEHLAACFRSGNDIVIRDAHADVARALNKLRNAGQL